MYRLRPRHAVPVLALVLAASCTEAPPYVELELSGIVAQEREIGGAPIGGALVRFTSDTGLVTQTSTGSDGRYAMRVTTDVSFGQVRAEAEGYTPAERTVYFDRPERRIDVRLRRPAP